MPLSGFESDCDKKAKAIVSKDNLRKNMDRPCLISSKNTVAIENR